MSKRIILIILTSLIISCSENFQKIPEKKSYDEELLKEIVPNQNVDYWQIDYIYGFTPKKIFSKGNTQLAKEIPLPDNQRSYGFFSGCQPDYCNYRILYIKDNKWNYIDNEEALAKFIDQIDNEKEAFLIARINDYDIDNNSPEGNGFKKTDDGYKLKVMIYKSCPESKQSFIVTVAKNGKLKNVENQGYYYKSKDCLVY
jgi:hypothetical protein